MKSFHPGTIIMDDVSEWRCAMSIEYKVIGRNIRAARKAKMMTQEAVAEAIDMSL